MLELLKAIIKGYRRIIILGFGREGRSTYRTIRRVFPDITLVVADANMSVKQESETVGDNHVTFVTGSHYLQCLTEKAVVFKSPGVSFNPDSLHPESLLTSQTDLFIQHYGNQTIGVSGTKGKSTTSSLIFHFLSQNKLDAVLLGNIGIPAFDKIDEINDKTWIVFELSAHQLQYVQHSPHIAVLLNIFPEHLDYFTHIDNYTQAKKNLFAFQQPRDVLIRPYAMKALGEEADSVQVTVADHGDFADINLDENDGFRFFGVRYTAIQWPLVGHHNRINTLMAIAAGNKAGMEVEEMLQVLPSFRSLPHRLEYVAEFNGITYYNDSISTVPASAMAAVEALKEVGTIILGGYDRGLDYIELVSFLMNSKVEYFVFIGKAGKSMLDLFSREVKPNLFWFDNFSDGVLKAIQQTKPGKICLLSPAAASYDEFHNFEHRGDKFRELVRSHHGK